jgi:hypothetical protein
MKTVHVLWLAALALVFHFAVAAFERFMEAKEQEIQYQRKQLILMEKLDTCPNAKVSRTAGGYECTGRVMLGD